MPKTAFVFILFLFLVADTFAQYRIGGINTEMVFEKIPAAIGKQMDSVFTLYQDSLNKEYKKLEEAVNSETERWVNCHDCPPPHDSAKESRRSRLINMIQNLNNFQQYADSLIQKRGDALRAQFFISFKEQLKPIALECGYDIIIDLCTYRLLPMPQCTDITGLMLQKLSW
jgi:Skp family chaperone for outer membrane proteins